MIVYNVTVKIDSEIEQEWLEWMRSRHIPDVMNTGCFAGHEMLRLRFPQDEEGCTFAIQYHCRTMDDLERYHRDYATNLQKDHVDKYGEKAVAFRTILEKLDQTADSK